MTFQPTEDIVDTPPELMGLFESRAHPTEDVVDIPPELIALESRIHPTRDIVDTPPDLMALFESRARRAALTSTQQENDDVGV